ncbi:MAG: hypothetical protein CO092_00665 [Candidatus Aenigmarchaeota archaeon CG_4_9_14_3_um_filter_37_18]|nr:MAG: hypothetical protein AUJ50_03335 [Candidatus Aenigmarchaeota archaeon CG1_02_38_14]PIV68485.1 MAG: hypothetical protein COS07_03955 [Candidatus Aenigmarchaeota archaeon CG01_land_8_20_14_3_00_37_9]PIW41574.1 MAG: hypothetical protein COW21_01190 [Candidatus Aenigmarchaeota archaeon CG15_BIG_FIL_POST_REV_8_21_14_020_37_27]PJB75896.1 MAG: hypothetical protein CO092_00665 [Candidatus Aenigmarchaeota archaeon CG_4_9_14_3_um_filter_37_18]
MEIRSIFVIREGKNSAVVEGKKVHFYSVGHGKPIIFIHAWGISWRKSERKIGRFLGSEFNSIFLSLPGTKGSDELEVEHTMENYADFVYKFSRALKLGKVYVVGFSMGTIIAINFAKKYPLSVRKIALLGTPFRIKAKNLLKLRKHLGEKGLLNSWIVRNPASKFFIRAIMTLYGFKWKYSKITVDGLFSSSPRSLKESMESILKTDVEKLFREINAQTLFFHGEKDMFVEPPNPNQKNIIFLPDSGHGMVSKQPDYIAEKLIEFFGSKK